MLSTGEIREVTNNDAHSLIELGQAELVKKLVTAQAFEPQSTAEFGQSSSKRGFRRRGKYLIK